MLGAQDGGREVNLTRLGRNFCQHLGGRIGQSLPDHVQAAFAEVVVDINHRNAFELGLVADVARHFWHGRRLREAGAENIRIALLGDAGRFTAGEVGHFGAARLGHADHDGTGKHGAKNRKNVVVNGFLRQAFGNAGVALGVGGGGLDFFAENAAGGVDLLDGQLNAVFEVGARGGAAAGQLDDVGDLDHVLRKTGAGSKRDGAGSYQFESESFLHGCLLWGLKINALERGRAWRRRAGSPPPSLRGTNACE